MFAKATSNFVKQIDLGGCLIPVSCLNDSDKLQPLALLVKRRRFWLWQKTKYISSDFTLGDVLHGDQPLEPVVVESDFLTYEGTFGDSVSGKVETSVGQLGLNVEGKGSTKLQSSFGSLRKQEVDVHHLLQHSEGRALNMEHSLVQQTRGRRGEVFCLLKEKVFTTQKCSIAERVQEQESCAGRLSFAPRRIQVSVNENGSLQLDSNVILEIPPKTTLAYSIIELDVKLNGEYELCLLPDTHGGFEVDGVKRLPLCDMVSVVDGLTDRWPGSPEAVPSEAPLTVLREDLEGLSALFRVFVELPAARRSALFRAVSEVLAEKEVVSVVGSALEQLCRGEQPALADLAELQPSQRRSVRALLAEMGHKEGEETGAQPAPRLLSATHALLSAADEMPDAGLAALSCCCNPETLLAVECLLRSFLSGGEACLSDGALSALTDEETLRVVELLFSSCSVALQRGQAALTALTGQQPGFLPLALSAAVTGLAALGTERG